MACVAGAVVRALWVFAIHPPLDYVSSDMQGYVDRAVRLASGDHLARYDAFYPPGTHVLLAAPMTLLGTGRTGLWGGAVLWWAMSSLTPLIMWRLAGLLLSPAAAFLTAVFCAAWPLHITYAGYFLSETPALFFLVLALWLGYRAGRAPPRPALGLGVAAGLAGGAAVANRPQFLLNLAILAVSLLMARRRNTTAATGLAIGTLVLLGGVVAYNSAAAGRVTGLSENGGLTFFIGHCDVGLVHAASPATNQSWTFGAPPAIQRHDAITYTFPDHAVWEQGFFYGKGIDCIRADGLRHLALTARSVADMTATTVPWPQSDERHLAGIITAFNVLYSIALVFILAATLGVVRRRRERDGPSGELILLAHLLCVLPLAVVVFGDPRFRTPYDVFGLALLAALVARRWLEPETETAA